MALFSDSPFGACERPLANDIPLSRGNGRICKECFAIPLGSCKQDSGNSAIKSAQIRRPAANVKIHIDGGIPNGIQLQEPPNIRRLIPCLVTVQADLGIIPMTALKVALRSGVATRVPDLVVVWLSDSKRQMCL